MKLSYSKHDVQRWRDKVYHRTANTPITNERQALAFINKVGFCLTVRSEGLELPNLWDAVTGTKPSNENGFANGTAKRSYFLSYAWEIQHILPNHNSVFYGKVFRRRPSLISCKYLPYFYALSQRSGTKDEYKNEHTNGRLSPAATSIMDVLAKNASMTARELRNALTSKGKKSPASLERSLDELQRKMFITRIVGNGNQVGAIWALVVKCFPKEVRKAQRISSEEARVKLLEKYFQTQLVSTVESIHNVFGWPRPAIFQTIGQLVHAGVITTTIISDDNRGTHYCLVQ